MDLIYILIGIGLLYLGGEGLVRGASALGRLMGLSPLVIGLTIVSVGTSSPELATSLAGVLEEAPAVAFGNVVGSNIANLGLVLGLTALVRPLRAASQIVRREMPVMLVVSAAVFPLIWDGEVGRVEGLLLLVILAIYLRQLFRLESPPEVEATFESQGAGRRGSGAIAAATVVGGIGLLVLGAHLLITGAIGVATALGVSERVIGLTLVAFGTSLPELAASLVAAFRRQADIVLGNLIGSNLFNVLFILGTTAVVRPVAVDRQASWLDLGVMMVVSFGTWLFMRRGSRLTRNEGLALFLAYGVYTVYLFL